MVRNFRHYEGISDKQKELRRDSKTEMKLKNLFESKVHQCVLEYPASDLVHKNNSRVEIGTKQALGQQELK